MKKIISLLLIFTICLSFVACGNNSEKEKTDNTEETKINQNDKKNKEAEQAIIGEWIHDDDTIAIFNNDNTAIVKNSNGEITNELRWKYDEELDLYIVVFPYQNPELFGITIENENGMKYIDLGSKFYRVEDKK